VNGARRGANPCAVIVTADDASMYATPPKHLSPEGSIISNSLKQ
jgi:hypothetical protein